VREVRPIPAMRDARRATRTRTRTKINFQKSRD
jgi:hypothetical protein